MSSSARPPAPAALAPSPALHESVIRQAERTPEATALVFERETWTYGELAERAADLAHRLRSGGVGYEAVVAVCLDRSPELVQAILGVLAAGAAYLPLDPADPPRRLASLLADAGVRTCLTRDRLRPRLAGTAGVSVLTEPDWLAAPASSPPAPEPVGGDRLAYVIYTSGSTGRPKGVMIEHRSAQNRIAWFCREFRLDAGEVFLQKTPYTFDVSVPEFFCPLVTGGRLVLARPDGHRDANYLRRLIRDAGVTTVHFVPSMLAAFLDEPGLEECRSLRRVLCSGEALPASLRDRFLRTLGRTGCQLVNLYGPTETAIEVSAWTCGPDRDAPTVPIGRALPNVELHVLDGGLRPVPPGELGELLVGGVQVARGYLGRPDLTAAAFVPDPFGRGARLYRTGDLVHRRPDGALEFHGRFDDQVKVRGFRVELGEIEGALLEHPTVREAVVVARPGPAGDVRLVGYVVPRSGEPAPSSGELSAFLGERLPAHMVPSALVALDELPRSASGKIARSALPEPDVPAASAPRVLRGAQAEIASIWAEVLGLSGVGPDQEFGDLGGHSLHAVQVLARIARRLGVRLEIRDLFESRTVSGLAARAEAARAAAGAELVGPGRRAPDEPAELSMAQRRLWFVEQLSPGSVAYNVAASARLRGDLDVDALAWALGEVERRHEVLRSAFPSRDGLPGLELRHPGQVVLPVTEVARPDDLAELVEAEAATPFDVAAGPLFRARLLRLAPRDHVLTLTGHHAVFDGWSLEILCRELGLLYRARREGAGAPLAELPLQFADYVAWQRRHLAGPALDRLVGWWRQELAGAALALELPADRPRPAVASFRGGRRRILAPRRLTDAVEEFSRRQGVTVFVTLLSAFELLVSRLTGAEDLVVGTPVAGRDDPEVEELIGMFVNMLPLRGNLAGDPTFRRLVARTHETVLRAFEHQEIPVDRLVGELRMERDLSRNPVFQVVFNMYSFQGPRLELPGLEVEFLDDPTPGSPFDLTLYVRGESGRLRFDVVHSTDLFDGERMDELLRQYVLVLEQVMAEPDRSLGEVSLVTARARTLLPDPAAPLPPRPLPSLITRLRDHAAAEPDRPAVVDPTVTLSYGQLDRGSDELAARLLAGGLPPGRVVAVHAERRAWLVVAILAAMKARAPFLLLDTAYPPARLVDYLRRSNPAAWLDLAPARPGPELESWLAERRGLQRLRLPGAPGESAPPVPAGPAPAGEELAYVAFTSGSTGRPRGVVGTHVPLWHFLDWYQDEFGLGREDRFAMLGGLSHDPLLRDVLAPLWVGGSLHVPAPEDWPASQELLRWLIDSGVTVLHLTPLLGRLLRRAGERGSTLPAVRLACFGGAALTAADVAGFAELAPGARLVNFYGATETPQAVGYRMVRPGGAPPGRAVVPLGRGIDGVQLLVLAGDRQAGIGEPGEICVRTPYLAAGYLDEPEQTAARFVPNPATKDLADRVYRTGDLGRYLPDGDVEFAGRADRQVEVRGFRVEPSEVEQSLRSHPAVAEAVVVPVVRDGERGLVAYVSPRGTPPAPAALRAHLLQRLPEYMVPADVVTLERLPLTPNGKIDLRALPAPPTPAGPGSTAATVDAPVPPGTIQRAGSRAMARLNPPRRRRPGAPPTGETR